MAQPLAHGIAIKKQYGQHFLRDQSVVDNACHAVTLTPHTSVFEIGCGDGFLTRTILQQPCARLWVFEIDSEWAAYVQKTYLDKRLSIYRENFLEMKPTLFAEHAPWVLLANLPYAVTFPILHKLYEMRNLLDEGVIMVQEEVAQKIIQKSGRGYGYVSLFFQYYFDWKLLEKVKPKAFVPPPKVDSRLLYFKPKRAIEIIPWEYEFWKFIRACFHQPRRTLRNNLHSYTYDLTKIPAHYFNLRAQQMSMEDFLAIWKLINDESF